MCAHVKKGNHSPGTISVCVPVYNAEDFLEETLNSILGQSFHDMHIIISVDKSDDRSIDICLDYLADRRIALYEQSERIGWVANSNFLLDKVHTDFFCIIPHDDVLDAEYIAVLRQALLANPHACVAYSDIQCFGKSEITVIQDSLTGDPATRIVQYLTEKFAGVYYRGLVRRSILSDLLHLRGNAFDGFAADTTWGLQMACRGDLIRCPGYLYHKRLLPHSAHDEWKYWDEATLLRAWAEHCYQCTDLILKESFSHEDRRYFLFACLQRLLRTTCKFWRLEKYNPDNTHQNMHLINTWLCRLLQLEEFTDIDMAAMPDINIMEKAAAGISSIDPGKETDVRTVNKRSINT